MERLKVLLVVAGCAGLSAGAALGGSMGAEHAALSEGRLVHSANAQEGDEAEDDEMMAQIMVLAINREAAEMYADLMGMDQTQREIALDMHREYMGKYRDAASAIRDVMEKMEEAFFEEDEEKAAATMRDFSKVIMGFYERTVTLADQLVGDFGALALDEAQQAGHERVRRARVRQEALALMSSNGNGEVLDLLALSQRLDQPIELRVDGADDAAAARVLLEYEREMHPTCERVVELTIKSMKAQFDMMSQPESEQDWEAAMVHEAELEKLSSEMLAITDRASRRVQQSLPPDVAQKWDRAVKEARYPQVYAAGEFERALDIVLGLDDLTADQRESVEATRDAWRRDAEAANTRWVKAIDDFDRLLRNWPDSEDPEVMQKHWEDYQKADEENSAAALARSELDERFVDRLRQILTPEQQAKLPASDAGVDVDEVLRQMGGG